MIKRSLPSSASVATASEDGKLVAPAASRNTDALCAVLQEWGPSQGQALEIASGTGQHVRAFAEELPGLAWQPSEVDPERRMSIDAYTRNLPNVAPVAELDAATSGWHRRFYGQDLIVLINLIHLISWQETRTIISEVAQSLSPKGRFILYGPFKRSGQLTSDGDVRFHKALIQQDPEIGYKNDADILDLFENVGLDTLAPVEMPANNLAFIAERPDV
ncbi:class I SAM-dependent methyltransferase [Ruegeria marisrubri]|uniref:DUF938 domain-containing protein n=1 Tax=Ruegeria marisrubri TaxID=1685379 RepID=UPI001CD802A5|nr:DUF938 domain-containing protein [Ruegeria marisrubri]MCA0905421.1 class I SAM-dependent methyltransferase [Ruegeria marisrubri]